jgi:hypothetical protein
MVQSMLARRRNNFSYHHDLSIYKESLEGSEKDDRVPKCLGKRKY